MEILWDGNVMGWRQGTLSPLLPLHEQTDTCENITFCRTIVVDWIISVLQDTRFFSRERYWISNKAKHNYQVHSQYHVYQFISSFNQSVKFNKFVIQESYPYT